MRELTGNVELRNERRERGTHNRTALGRGSALGLLFGSWSPVSIIWAGNSGFCHRDHGGLAFRQAFEALHRNPNHTIALLSEIQ
jgi:hypothetical protein